MKEWATRVRLPKEVREQVKEEQEYLCFICRKECEGHELFVHHKEPVSHHQPGEGAYANRRENLCALCGECHATADHMALERNKYLVGSLFFEGYKDREIFPIAAD